MSCPGPSKNEGGTNENPATALNADDMVTIYTSWHTISISHVINSYLNFTQKRKKEAELLKKYVEHLTKLESTFITIMTGILKRYSQHVVDSLKVLLECPICQELIIEVYNII